MIIALPREVAPGENRVALTPETVKKLLERRVEVVVQAGAGEGSLHSDADYEHAGARIEPSVEALYQSADMVLKVREPLDHPELGRHEVDLMKEGTTLVSFLYPTLHDDLVRRLQERRVCAFAMDQMPRITRAQSMDCLSSMSSIAGYKAVLVAANHLPKYFPMLMTAAGTVTASRVFVLGAGVAGLQAIATARRLGAVVEAYDVRRVVREQVESLGARFVQVEVDTPDAEGSGGYAREQTEEEQRRLQELLHDHVRKADAVITTALVPGKPAPRIVTAEMVRAMKPGSVIVDLAAEMGGNCELSRPGETVVENGVQILGPVNLPGEMAYQSSQLYSRNLVAFVLHLLDEEGSLHLDLEDELTRGPLVTRDGEIVHGDAGAAPADAPAEDQGGEG